MVTFFAQAVAEAEIKVRNEIAELQASQIGILKDKVKDLREENDRLVTHIGRLEREVGQLTARQQATRGLAEDVEDLRMQRMHAIEEAHALRQKLDLTELDLRDSTRQKRELDSQLKRAKQLLHEQEQVLKGQGGTTSDALEVQVQEAERAAQRELERQIAELKAALEHSRTQLQRCQRERDAFKEAAQRAERTLLDLKAHDHAPPARPSFDGETAMAVRAELEREVEHLKNELRVEQERSDKQRSALQAELDRVRTRALPRETAIASPSATPAPSAATKGMALQFAFQVQICTLYAPFVLSIDTASLQYDLDRREVEQQRRLAREDAQQIDALTQDARQLKTELALQQTQSTGPNAQTAQLEEVRRSLEVLEQAYGQLEAERDSLRRKLDKTTDVAKDNLRHLEELQRRDEDFEDLLRLNDPQQISLLLRSLRRKYGADALHGLEEGEEDRTLWVTGVNLDTLQDIHVRLDQLHEACLTHDQKRSHALEQVAQCLMFVEATEAERDRVLDVLQELVPPSSSLQQTVNALVDQLVYLERELDRADEDRRTTEARLAGLVAANTEKRPWRIEDVTPDTYDLLLRRIEELEREVAMHRAQQRTTRPTPGYV
ncbi:uncharacterized protein MONBRDRAFT_22353 [Monosiga brevicollis MX1]|uniref:Uncharacterized protein n=1 Tax=Monosiga brevicollis TaxID=81824 RepID=A9UQB9_MONBE|nr:uncharacterized protein MONBRDRAFT_22353 [Monosiga brevicollis MX1]EDQ93021.1 predicted protein [Monosiga brevicollis MX1]|eukprot:XP_001742783.1 hypothetical protein [Monosiga brevicollis MX1]